jgi:hydrogenase maturation protease
MGDDAAGPWVVEHLRAGYDVGSGVSLTDVGTPGLDLVPHLGGARVVVLVDTVKSAGEAGELRLYRKEEILKHPPGPRTSPHDPGVKETLLYLDLAGQGPEEVLLVGIVPGRVEKGLGLTPAVAAAVPEAAEAVAAELRRLGVSVERRAGSPVARPWWAGEEPPAP